MAKFPALWLWTDAWLADTHHLSRCERGTYMDLLILMWRTPGGSVPNDDEWLGKRMKMSAAEVEKELRPLIAEFCQTDGNRIFQKRLRIELNKAQQNCQKQSEKAKSRWNKEKDICYGNAEAYAAAMPSTTTTNKESNTSKTQTRSAPAEAASKRGPATALPTGAPARSEGSRKSPSPEPRSGSSYAVNTPATMAELERAKADRQKQRLGISPDEGDRRYPSRARPEHAHALEPIPDQLPAKRSTGEDQDFAPGTLPQCGQCSCPISPSGEQKCWAKILANSTMGKLEMAQ